MIQFVTRATHLFCLPYMIEFVAIESHASILFALYDRVRDHRATHLYCLPLALWPSSSACTPSLLLHTYPIMCGWQIVFVHCRVLQCVAVCCSVLQCVAVCPYSPFILHTHLLFYCIHALSYVAGRLYWCVAVCCRVLQCVAVYTYNPLFLHTRPLLLHTCPIICSWQILLVCCSELQCLQYVTVCSSVFLQLFFSAYTPSMFPAYTPYHKWLVEKSRTCAPRKTL